MHSTMPSPSTSVRSTPPSCSSTPSQPIQIGFGTPRRNEITYDPASYSSNASNISTSSTSSTSSSTPSPYGSSCLQRNAPNSYFSDAELFGDDEEVPFLEEAPAPPRGAEAWLAQARAQGHGPPATATAAAAAANGRPLGMRRMPPLSESCLMSCSAD